MGFIIRPNKMILSMLKNIWNPYGLWVKYLSRKEAVMMDMASADLEGDLAESAYSL